MFTYRQMLAFYFPLMLQAMAQTLTYPLVATVIVRGEYGSTTLAAFAQGQTVMFILGTLGVGLITAGMVYALDKNGYRNFFRLNLLLTGFITTLQIAATCPPFSDIIFGQLLNLEAPLKEMACETLLLCIPAHICFMLRAPYQVALYNERESGKANFASMGRVIITALLAQLWCEIFEIGGVRPAVIVFTIPIVFEVLISYLFARKYIRKLRYTEEAASVRQQFTFCIPLTLGSFLLALTAFIVPAFIGRSTDDKKLAEMMLTVHYIVMGIITPLAFGGMRMQTVALSFFNSHGFVAQKKLFRFAIMIGFVLGGISLLLQVPFVANWYFGSVQNLNRDAINMASYAALFLLPLPLLQALRSCIEGMAAWQKRSDVIFYGQIANLFALGMGLWITYELAMPGYLMGVIAVPFSVIVTHLTMKIKLRQKKRV